ncbi:transmembrane protein 72-like [Saccoglossus kowalevskii]|uniref:Transmembrane protein 72-like n=1 Tax=Saccoglossus kowalevskii TaxID=10224 RepID=A0ABM0MKH8_SACKO|nr:PREDICTED: transmembrane protein 72-like [Saccoglossus kowalevskii]
MAETTPRRCGLCWMLWDHFTFVARVWGILTAIGLWGIGIETCHRGDHIEIGVYLIFTAIIVTFFEALFLLNPCVKKCCSEDTCCGKCWSGILWIDNWKRGILYILLSIVCFLNPHTVWMAVISGIMLIISAVLHSLHTIKDAKDKQGISNENYGRFREVEGDDMIAPIGGARVDAATHSIHNIEPLFKEDAWNDESTKDVEEEIRSNPFRDESTERKRSNSFDLGTGSSGLAADDAQVTGTLEV